MKRKLHPFIRFIDTPAPEAGGGGNNEPEDAQEAVTEEPADEPEDDESEDGWDRDKALEKIRKTNAEAKALRERAKAAEAKAAGADEIAKALSDSQAENLRLKVALKYGLDEKIASRLQGETEEDLLKDAEELLGLFQPKAPSGRPQPKLSGTRRASQEEAQPESLDDLGKRMFGH